MARWIGWIVLAVMLVPGLAQAEDPWDQETFSSWGDDEEVRPAGETEGWRTTLLTRLDHESQPLAFASLGFGVSASVAHVATPLRGPYAPQFGFTLAGLGSFHLIQLGFLGIVRQGLVLTATPGGLRRAMRGWSWALGVTSVHVGLAFSVWAIAGAGQWEPTWAFAALNIPLALIAATVSLSVWADRLAQAHDGEADLFGPRYTRRGRPRPRAVVGPGALVVTW